ncbi:hypothetical protein GGR54DRAFT_629357 [Hypoxylon sp. NC1633]|nr:hypothetical protein GGR54DRAFT_629357 [Hypoxylon sp. NC1633]
MCYQLIERYSACHCLYYQHAVDRCAAYGQSGHHVTTRTILVGYACQKHAQSSNYGSYARGQTYSDSGYYSGQSRESSHRQRRDWVSYLYSFRSRPKNLSPSRQPSQLSLLLVGHDRIMSTSAPPTLQ